MVVLRAGLPRAGGDRPRRLRARKKRDARMLGYGDFDTTMNVLAKAVEKGPWLMGDQFTAADVLIGPISAGA